MKFHLKALVSAICVSIPLICFAGPAKKTSKPTTTSTTVTTNSDTSSQSTRTGSSKNEKHGDGGRAQQSAEKQIAELEAQLYNGMPRNDRLKIEQKIKNIKATAAKKARGEEHSRIGKR